ncbi:MAG: tetratricopeptide repeat protein [Myxococcales bacterium]|nr:tetratricopeptide repeat protein [Myxococcales bacterium]
MHLSAIAFVGLLAGVVLAGVAVAQPAPSAQGAPPPQTAPGVDPRLAAAFERFDHAVPTARDAIRREIDAIAATKPGDAPFAALVGTLWLMRSEWLSAEPYLRAALPKMPGFAPVTHALGVVLLQTSRPEDAEVLLRPAVQQFASDPLIGDLLFNLAMACAMVNKRLEASEWFEKALAVTPNAAINHFSIGENELNLHRLDRAEAAFRKAMELDPPHPDARWKLAITLVQLARFGDAEALFRQAVSVGPLPSRVAASYQFGVYLFEQGRAGEALPLLQAVTAAKPGDRMAWNWEARVLKALGRREESTAALRRYRELQAEADKSETEFLLGLIRDKLTRPDGKPVPERG